MSWVRDAVFNGIKGKGKGMMSKMMGFAENMAGQFASDHVRQFTDHPDDIGVVELRLHCGSEADSLVEMANKEIPQFLEKENEMFASPMLQQVLGLPFWPKKFQAERTGVDSVSMKLSGCQPIQILLQTLNKMKRGKFEMAFSMGLDFDDLLSNPNKTIFELMTALHFSAEIDRELINSIHSVFGLGMGAAYVKATDLCMNMGFSQQHKLKIVLDLLSGAIPGSSFASFDEKMQSHLAKLSFDKLEFVKAAEAVKAAIADQNKAKLESTLCNLGGRKKKQELFTLFQKYGWIKTEDEKKKATWQFETWPNPGLEELLQELEVIVKIEADLEPEKNSALLKSLGLFHRLVSRIEGIQSISFSETVHSKHAPLTFKFENFGRTSFCRVFDHMLMSSYRALGLSESMMHYKDDLVKLNMRKIARLEEQLAPLGNEAFPKDCIAPSALPPFKSNKDVYNNPEMLLMLGQGSDAPFYNLVDRTLKFMDKYLERGYKQWVFQEERMSLKTVGLVAKGAVRMKQNLGDACVLAYNGVHAMIQAQENAAYEERKKIVDASAWSRFQYDDAIDKIADRAEGIVTLYKQASIMKEQHFDPLIQDVAFEVGGRAHLAPLKGFLRVAEKIAMRPDGGVPWDICRAQVECDTMQALTKALTIIISHPMVKTYAINDRFANPKGGWCDISLYLGFDSPECGQVVAEVQLVHYKMMKVREEFGGHDAYNDDRFASEVAFAQDKQRRAGTPWSVGGESSSSS